MLEGRCAAEAVRRQTTTDLRKLNAIHQKMEEHVAAGDGEAYHRATDQLHEKLHAMAANPWLLRATTDLRRFLRLARGMSRQPDGRLLHSLAEHRTLMKTITRGDAESAEQVMHHHLLAQQKNWRSAHLNAPRERGGDAGAGPASTDNATASPAAASGIATAAPGPSNRVTATANQHAEAESISV
jgi:DNA-binding GntR family transcriptional regulator